MAEGKRQPTPPEIRAARSFLISKGIPLSVIAPRAFAAVAKEQEKGFREVLRFIARLYMGGQNQAGWRQEVIISQADQ